MDQIKIGKFIAELRKEQNMTQLTLANKLEITDRAVSKWENGRGLPDLSLITPLCEALNISVNELLSGERIQKENIEEKSEENIINALEYSDKSIKKTKKVFFCILTVIITVCVMTAIAFGIDTNRMRNNRPVVFSTWGLKYAPTEHLDDEEMEIAVRDYLVAHGDSEVKHHDNEKTFVAFRPYLYHGTEKKEKYAKYYVYAWVLEEKLYTENNIIKKDSGSSIPYMFTVERHGDKYTVTDSRIPRDGSFYAEDIKNIFPKSVRDDIKRSEDDGTFEKLKLEIHEQARQYFYGES